MAHAADPSPAAAALVSFAQQLYAALADEVEGNVVVSPWSLSVALSLAWAGARGDTAAALRRTLCHAADDGEALASAGALEVALREAAGADVDLATARRLYVEASRAADVLPAWSELVADLFGADAADVDFVGAPDIARIAINAWVASQTRDQIDELVPPGAIDTETRAVLVDAVYLLAKWEVPFHPGLTRPDAFTLPDGAEVEVPMMSAQRELPYASTDDAEAVRLGYAGGALAMTVILPRPGLFDEVSQRLAGASWRTGLRFRERDVALRMPRFSVRQGGSVLSALRAMGLGPALGAGADFGALMRGEGVAIGEVVHEACVTVDEAGTEAAAATAVVMKRLSLPVDPPTLFVIDRPFFFVIEHVATGAPLFFARVLDPR